MFVYSTVQKLYSNFRLLQNCTCPVMYSTVQWLHCTVATTVYSWQEVKEERAIRRLAVGGVTTTAFLVLLLGSLNPQGGPAQRLGNGVANPESDRGG